MAVPVDDDTGQTLISDTYTINDVVDFIGKQEIDDEIQAGDTIDDDPMGARIDEELAATQALGAEIEKAAAELANNADFDGDASMEIQLTDLSDFDLTSELEAQNDDHDKAVTAGVESDDVSIEMPAKDKSAS
jgi:hypothetical protein